MNNGFYVDLQNFINIHFNSKDLGKLMLETGKAAMLHFIYNSKVVCVLISHDIEQGEFVLQVPYYPPIETLDDFKNDPARCVKIVIDAIRSQEDGSFS